MRARISASPAAAPERHVRAVREQLVPLDLRAVALEVELLEAVRHLDRHLRVAHLHELERELAAGGPERARAVLAPAREVRLGAQAHAADVHRAEVALDARADLAGRGAHRERVVLGPAVAAQVHHGLAHAVAGQLGLRAVRVVDPDLGDEAALVRLPDQQDPVRADPGVRRADGAHAPGRQLERELTFLDDHVVVAQRLPLLEVHGAGLYASELRHLVEPGVAAGVVAARRRSRGAPGSDPTRARASAWRPRPAARCA